MPLPDDIARLNWGAIMLGVAAGIVVYVVASIPYSIVVDAFALSEDTAYSVSFAVPVVAYLCAGLATGRVAQRTPLLHGVILGFFIVLVYFAINGYVGRELTPFALFRVTLMAVGLSVLGAWLASRNRNKPSG